MHIPLLLVVAGVLIAALVVLLLSLYLLESHVDQNGLHLKRFKQGFYKICSSPNHQSNHQPQACSSRGAKADPQICCICGTSKYRHQHETTASPLMADRMWNNSSACVSSASAGAQVLECLSRLARSCESGSLFRERGNRSSSGVEEDEKSFEDRFHAAAASVPFVISSSAASLLSTVANTGSSRSKSESLGSISTSSLISTSSSEPPASQNVSSDIKDRKQTPQRRLVLEILMSPPSQARNGQEQTLPCPAGLRLKLEANATLDSPLNDSHGEANNGVQQEAENDQKPVLINNFTKASHSSSSSSIDDRILIDKQVSLLPNVDGKVCNNPCSNERGPSAGMKDAACFEQESHYSIAVSDCGDELKDRSAYGEGRTASSISAITPRSSSTKRITGYCLSSNGQFTTAACEAVAQSTPVPLCNNGDPITKLNPCVNLISEGSECSDLSQELFSLEKCLHEKSCWSFNKRDLQSARTSSLDGLGSLKLTSLETGVRNFCTKDITKEVNADIASAIAALTVDTGSRMDLGSGLSEIRPPEPKERISFELSSGIAYNHSHTEKVKHQGIDCEQRTAEQDEHHQASMDKREAHEDHVDGGKSEKRKKKNRGRRQKGKSSLQTEPAEGSKTAAFAAMCGQIEEHAKLKPRSVDTVRVHSVTEVEVGCICGAARGGLHGTSCPYPFTSSGSMVQRKIKEQYDDLVRSNAAKRLTLAQVGRFTTCLVETKVSLQQKSETIQRRFTITKSLLAKADKSCFDRLCGQIYALEVEQKKLEEDTIVYNRLQEQLKQSPAYQKMLEYGRRHFELQPNTGQLIEKANEEGAEMSFEELLAKEKRDSFW
ncbi:hypothetical protein O6H91_12G077300 [Diphasiastrum complanatum]|nr:hypothetical protein O6H91_12G077300 [Diphasiastrum complanatum]